MRAREPKYNLGCSHTATVARVVLTSAVLALTVFSTARGQAIDDDATRAAARLLGEEGMTAFLAEDFATAATKLDRANRLYAVPTLGLWSARAHFALGHWVEASERFRTASRTSPEQGDENVQREAQSEAQRELDELWPRLPHITVEISPSGLTGVLVTLDGAPLPEDLVGVARPINPGDHVVVATHESQRVEVSLRLAERQHSTLPIVFPAPQPIPPDPEPTKPEPTKPELPLPIAASQPPSADNVGRDSASAVLRPVGVSALALGGASLIGAGVAWIVAQRLGDRCPTEFSQPVCETARAADRYNDVRSVALWSFYGGVSLVGVGLVSWLLADHLERSREPHVGLHVGPGGAALHGTF